MGFPSKNTGVGCHFLLQGIFPDPGIEPVSPASLALAGGFSGNPEPHGKPSLPLCSGKNPNFFVFYSSVSLFKNKNCICLRCTWWFDAPIHSEMIATVKLINISIFSHRYFFFLMKALEIYSLSGFWEYNTVLFTTVRVFTSPLDLTHPAELQFCVLWPTFPHSSISLPFATTILFSASTYVT